MKSPQKIISDNQNGFKELFVCHNNISNLIGLIKFKIIYKNCAEIINKICKSEKKASYSI